LKKKIFERDVSFEKRPASVRVCLKRLIKETYINEKSPLKETYICSKKVAHKRDVSYEKRPASMWVASLAPSRAPLVEKVYEKRTTKETYICEKRPLKETCICNKKRTKKEKYVLEKRPASMRVASLAPSRAPIVKNAHEKRPTKETYIYEKRH